MSVKLKLKGLRFGNLVVIDFAGLSKRKLSLWRCQCDCGRVCVTTGNRLNVGATKSCGCKRSVPARNRKDLRNRVFGYLKVLRYSHTREGKSCWVCQCKCGKEFKTLGTYLSSGRTRSCGCSSQLLARVNPNSKHHGWAARVKITHGECLKCGGQNNLHAHHILARRFAEKTRVDFSNGATLCAKCHREFHRIYGKKNQSVDDFCKWMKMDWLSTLALSFFVGHRYKNGRSDIVKAINCLRFLLDTEYPLTQPSTYEKEST